MPPFRTHLFALAGLGFASAGMLAQSVLSGGMLASRKARLLKIARQLHMYIGIFSAPALLFFALSGALQTFSLHQATKGSDYRPAKWIAVMGELHKNQTAQLPAPKPARKAALAMGAPLGSSGIAPAAKASAPESGKASAGSPDRPVRHTLPLKIFFVIVSLSFFSSVLTGIYMSYKYSRNKLLVSSVLLTGVVVPILLAFV
jgi:cytochrome b subunit of formate dehydrogenase